MKESNHQWGKWYRLGRNQLPPGDVLIHQCLICREQDFKDVSLQKANDYPFVFYEERKSRLDEEVN